MNGQHMQAKYDHIDAVLGASLHEWMHLVHHPVLTTHFYKWIWMYVNHSYIVQRLIISLVMNKFIGSTTDHNQNKSMWQNSILEVATNWKVTLMIKPVLSKTNNA